MSDFTLFTGPILAGTQFNWGLFGVLTVQIYVFYSSFPDETRGIKALVYGIYCTEVLQTALSSHFAFEALVVNWGDPSILQKLPWSSGAIPITAGIVSACVQIFLARRIYLLSGRSRYSYPICALILGVSLMQCTGAIISGSLFARTSNPEEFMRVQTPVKIWLTGSAVCDVVISLTMIIILSNYRKKSPWKKTDTIIQKLIYHTIETGAVSAVVAVVDVVLFTVDPNNFLHIAPAFMLGKVYSNVMLATLNSRARGATTSSAGSGGHVAGSHQLKFLPQNPEQRRNQPSARVVQIQTTTEITDDFGGKISMV